MVICSWHLCENVLVAKQTKFCSIKCKNKYHVKKRRYDLRRLAIEYGGNCCQICGYNKCVGALEFHHKDPNKKDFGLSARGLTRSWGKTKEEISKCILLCANCHREIHYAE